MEQWYANANSVGCVTLHGCQQALKCLTFVPMCPFSSLPLSSCLENTAHAPKRDCQRRESIVDFLLFLGVILWSFPLAAIQAFAKAKFVAQIPGMEWILTYQGGTLQAFVNGYLPVLALLGLILVLPVLFGWIAVTCKYFPGVALFLNAR